MPNSRETTTRNKEKTVRLAERTAVEIASNPVVFNSNHLHQFVMSSSTHIQKLENQIGDMMESTRVLHLSSIEFDSNPTRIHAATTNLLIEFFLFLFVPLFSLTSNRGTTETFPRHPANLLSLFNRSERKMMMMRTRRKKVKTMGMQLNSRYWLQSMKQMCDSRCCYHLIDWCY